MFQRKRNKPGPQPQSGQRLSRSRSGLVLAGMRSLVALLLVLWLRIAPPHPNLGGSATAILFIAYLIFALALLAVAWRSWWYEFQLARPAFVIDVATLLSGLFLTEAVTLDFFSPFITFFAFLMLNSATRWSWRSLLLIAVGLVFGFLLAGWLIDWDGLPLDTARFTRRFSALVLLSLMLVWFASGRQRASAARYDRVSGMAAHGPFGGALDYALAAYGADGGVLAWLNEGETRPHVYAAGTMAGAQQTASIDLAGVDQPFLFDKPRQRQIILKEQKHLIARRSAYPMGLITACDLAEGLSIPIESRTGRGQLVLCGIAGMNSDDLFSAPGVAREIAAALDEEETEALAREVTLSRLRSQIATDLHDSVVQTLAGARFRLQALRRGIHGQEDAERDIDMICAGIAGEQDHVRNIIDQLRRGQIQPGHRDLHQELLVVCAHLARQWMVEITVAQLREPIIAPAALNFELQQILREATANAVRHGKASMISVEPSAADGRLLLDIVDNGQGFATPQHPRSIAGRVAWLGGGLTVTSAPGQTRIAINLPMDPVS